MQVSPSLRTNNSSNCTEITSHIQEQSHQWYFKFDILSWLQRFFKCPALRIEGLISRTHYVLETICVRWDFASEGPGSRTGGGHRAGGVPDPAFPGRAPNRPSGAEAPVSSLRALDRGLTARLPSHASRGPTKCRTARESSLKGGGARTNFRSKKWYKAGPRQCDGD